MLHSVTGVLAVQNGGSPFNETPALGTIFERNTTEDLLLGSNATSSAKFGFLNVAGGTPTASISGTSGNALSLTGNGTIGTTNGQSLTLGTTGNINFFSSANVLTSSGSLTLAGPLQIGGSSTVAYNRIGNGTTNYGLGTTSDLLVSGNLEVGGNLYAPATGVSGYFQRNNNAVAPSHITDDLLLGSTATTSAKFGFLNVAGGTPTASIAGTLALSGNGTIGTTNGQSLTLGSTGNINFFSSANVLSTTGNLSLAGTTGLTLSGNGASLAFTGTSGNNQITTASNQNLTITPNGLGNTILTSTYQSGVLIGSANNTLAPLSVSGGIGGNAAAIINQTNSGDILAASVSGNLKFAIANNGNLKFTGNTSFLNTLTSAATQSQTITFPAAAGGVGTVCYQNDSTCGFSLGTNYWQTAGVGAIAPYNTTVDVLLGGTSTASAKFAFLNNAGGIPTASISAISTNNALSLTANGTIGTTNGQTLTLGTGSTGNVSLAAAGRQNSPHLQMVKSVSVRRVRQIP